MSLKNIFGPKKLTTEQKRLYQTLIFLVRLLVLAIPLYIVLFFLDLGFIQNMVALEMEWLFGVLGFPVAREGLIFTAKNTGFIFAIAEDCTAWKSILFLFALLFAVPSSFFNKKGLFKTKKPKNMLKMRLLGLAIGIIVLWVGNLGRILGIVWVEQAFGVELAMIAHAYLWQLGLIALVLVVWVAWLWFNRPAGSKYKLRRNKK